MDRRKKILNFHEEATHVLLKKAASQSGGRTFAKVRIADVLEITSSGLSNDEYSYALKAHFDFVVSDAESKALFAVEFDGPHHDVDEAARVNDLKKNAICEKLDFPLLRITADFLTRKVRRFSLLSWLVELWFLNQAFSKAQEEGSIPFDEDFDYHNVLADSVSELAEGKITCPYDPALPTRLLLKRWYDKGVCKDFAPSVYVADNLKGSFVATAVIRLADESIIIGKANCRSFLFPPISAWELSQELAVVDAGEKMSRYASGNHHPCNSQQARALIKQLEDLAAIKGTRAFRCGTPF